MSSNHSQVDDSNERDAPVVAFEVDEPRSSQSSSIELVVEGSGDTKERKESSSHDGQQMTPTTESGDKDGSSKDLSAVLTKSNDGIIQEDNSIIEIGTIEPYNMMYCQSERKKQVKLSWKRLVVLLIFLLIFPIFPLAIGAALGGILALAEGAPFIDGFLYVVSNLLQFATPLTDFNPNNACGAIIDVYVSVVGYLTFGIVLNVINVFQVPLYVNQRIEACISGPIIVPTIALGLVVPIYVSIVGVIFGCLLAWLEGWYVVDGICYVLSNILGLATPLVDVTPDTVVGDIVDIIISSIALGAAAVVVDYVTVLNPARYIRKRLKERLDQFQAIDVDEPGISGAHPLAYDNEDEENASIRHDEEQRRQRRMLLQQGESTQSSF